MFSMSFQKFRASLMAGLLAATAGFGSSACQLANALESPTAPSSTSTTTQSEPASLKMTSYHGNVQVTPLNFGYRVTGTISVTLNRSISPSPSRVRAEWENSMVGGSVSYSGQTQFSVNVNQDTVACPNLSNSPTDHLRLIDVGRQVVLARGTWTWNGTVACR